MRLVYDGQANGVIERSMAGWRAGHLSVATQTPGAPNAESGLVRW
jgi:hypothetical protein